MLTNTSKQYFVVSAVLFFAFALSAFGQTKKTSFSASKQFGWYAVYDDGKTRLEIDLDSAQINGNIATVWEKYTYLSEKERKEYVERQLNYIYPKGTPKNIYKKWKNFAYNTARIVIDCDDATFAFLASRHYDDAGTALDSTDFNTPNWSYITPGSFGMILYNFACR